jgi:hypothetical protein
MQLDSYRPQHRHQVELGGQALVVGYSPSAWSRIHLLEGLHLQMELLYSCLVRKRVVTNGQATGLGQCHLLMDNGMTISFRPVVTQHCDVDTYQSGQPLVDMPMREGIKIRPRWLYIDHHKGQWRGEFGFA